MPGRRLGLLLVVLLALGARALSPVRAADEPTEKTFLAGLEKARTLLASGKPAEGLKLTNELLATHEKQDYVRAKRADLEDLVKRLSFGVRCPTPAPKDVVKGKLLSWSANPARVKLVGTPRAHDFEDKPGGMLVFPARFAGPYSVQLKGSAYPRDDDDTPLVLVGLEENRKTGESNSWTVVFGTAARAGSDTWMQPRIVRYEGKEREVLVEKDVVIPKADAPYRLEVDVGTGRISASANGKALGSCPKPTTLFGHLAFRCRGWEEVTVEGAIEPSWIQGKIDEVVQDDLATFEKGFEVRTLLPAWLYDAVPPTARRPSRSRARDEEESWPVPVPLAHEPAVEAVLEAYGADEHARALERVAALKTAGAPEALCAYLFAVVRFAQGDYTAALADVDRTLELVPGYVEALQLRGSLMVRLGREAEVETAFRKALDASPKDAALVGAAALSLLLTGRSDAARAVLEDAARRGLTGGDLDALARLVIKVTRGPDWAKSFEHKSSNYHVLSDIDADTCRRAATVLEEGLAAFKINLQGLEKAAPRQFRVYLFRGQGGFLNYMEDTSLFGGGGHPQAAGVYSPHLKQLLIWNLPSRDEMMRTVRHEGFHQYLDRLLPDAPAWLNEGLAVYYENMGEVVGQKYGAVHRDQLRILEEKRMLPMAEFLFQSHRDFMKQPDRSYAQAWLVVHMLRHGTSAQKALFQDLLTRLKTQTPYDALRAVFTPERVATLDAQLRQHAGNLAAAK